MRGRLFGVSRRSAAALLALLIVAIAATGASGAKLKTESASDSFGPFDFPSVTAGCGQGTKAVSGGFDTGSFDNFFAPLTLMREGARDWTTDGVNESPDTGTLTTFAYCRDQKVKSFTESATLSDDEVDTVVAHCPAGTKAVSGGFEAQFDKTAVVFPHASLKNGKRGWAVTAINYGPSPGTLTAQVNCSEVKKLKTKQVTESINNEVEDVVATCKRGRRVVSGGFASEDPISKGGPAFLASRKDGGRRWLVHIGANSAEITAYAYCEKKKKKK